MGRIVLYKMSINLTFEAIIDGEVEILDNTHIKNIKNKNLNQLTEIVKKLFVVKKIIIADITIMNK
jgi:hypothetical protein